METTAIQSANAVNATIVALANIKPNSFNPRRQFDDVALGELADSIRQQGVLQAIGLRPLEEADHYEIIYGERRYRASLMADKVDIPATIHHVTEEEAEEMAIAENLQRTDITPMEEANAYQRLGKRTPRCAVAFGAVRQVGGLYPHSPQILCTHSRNR